MPQVKVSVDQGTGFIAESRKVRGHTEHLVDGGVFQKWYRDHEITVLGAKREAGRFEIGDTVDIIDNGEEGKVVDINGPSVTVEFTDEDGSPTEGVFDEDDLEPAEEFFMAKKQARVVRSEEESPDLLDDLEEDRSQVEEEIDWDVDQTGDSLTARIGNEIVGFVFIDNSWSTSMGQKGQASSIEEAQQTVANTVWEAKTRTAGVDDLFDDLSGFSTETLIDTYKQVKNISWDTSHMDEDLREVEEELKSRGVDPQTIQGSRKQSNSWTVKSEDPPTWNFQGNEGKGVVYQNPNDDANGVAVKPSGESKTIIKPTIQECIKAINEWLGVSDFDVRSKAVTGTTSSKTALADSVVRVDPPGCACTDCIIGDSVPLDSISTGELDDVIEKLNTGVLQDATGMTEQEWDQYSDSHLGKVKTAAIKWDVAQDGNGTEAFLGEERWAVIRNDNGVCTWTIEDAMGNAIDSGQAASVQRAQTLVENHQMVNPTQPSQSLKPTQDQPSEVPGSVDMKSVAPNIMAAQMPKRAAWRDVRAKASRLREEQRFAVESLKDYAIEGIVRGDHGTYKVSVHTLGGGGLRDKQVSGFTCTCEWGKWAYNRETFLGRLCSHALCLYYEMQAMDRRTRASVKESDSGSWDRWPTQLLVRATLSLYDYDTASKPLWEGVSHSREESREYYDSIPEDQRREESIEILERGGWTSQALGLKFSKRLGFDPNAIEICPHCGEKQLNLYIDNPDDVYVKCRNCGYTENVPDDVDWKSQWGKSSKTASDAPKFFDVVDPGTGNAILKGLERDEADEQAEALEETGDYAPGSIIVLPQGDNSEDYMASVTEAEKTFGPGDHVMWQGTEYIVDEETEGGQVHLMDLDQSNAQQEVAPLSELTWPSDWVNTLSSEKISDNDDPEAEEYVYDDEGMYEEDEEEDEDEKMSKIASQFLQRTARKQYTLAEQDEFINEDGFSEDSVNELDLEGTHYIL